MEAVDPAEAEVASGLDSAVLAQSLEHLRKSFDNLSPVFVAEQVCACVYVCAFVSVRVRSTTGPVHGDTGPVRV